MTLLAEISRSTDVHSECIIFAFLRDGNGIPLSGVKIKLWAGPPPAGNPPYFVDDDPNNPNRRTDANGRFQFAVGGAPRARTDFFIQALDATGNPQSNPIQYTFMPGQAVWITVVLAPQGTNPTPGVIPAVPDLQLDSRLASILHVTAEFAQVTPGQVYWKLISAQYQDETQSGGNINIVCCAQDEYGQPAFGQKAVQTWPDGQSTMPTDDKGIVNFPMSGDSSFAPDRGEHGPYAAYMAGLPSDRVVGMGLPLRRHVQYVLTWRKVTAPSGAAHGSRIAGNLKGAAANLTVTLTSGSQGLTTHTDAAGNYEFANLSAGTYALAVEGKGVVSANLVLDGTNTLTVNCDLTSPSSTKPLTHYLLFGSPGLSATRTNLILALDYIARFQPTVGLRVEEAKNAQNVTIVGTGTVSAADEQALKDAGCSVRHVVGVDSYAIEQLFAQLVASGNPYPSN